MSSTAPILEFDPARSAIIEPHAAQHLRGIPSRTVLCFFREVLTELAAKGILKHIGNLVSEMGLNPVYTLDYEGQLMTVCHPGVGAALAAGFVEELISAGARSFIACGGCGVLDSATSPGHPFILTSAVRDEGTSYHYLPPSREAYASPEAVQALERVMQRHNIEYRLAKSWTTDALYRETEARRAQRMAEGCEVVEMEASAFFAVAAFRKVTFGQMVYGGDLVIPEGWDSRAWNERASDRQKMFWLAVEAAGEFSE